MFSPAPAIPSRNAARRPAMNDRALPTSHSARPYMTSAPTHQVNRSISDVFEPALDGPPSPESIRAFSKQMKRASNVDKRRSAMTTSSGSSSRRSTLSDRRSWDRGLESLSLSRELSERSTSGGMPPRDRPESMQLFGKAIFNRRGKLRRETSDEGPSSSSLLSSAEPPMDSGSALPRDQRFIQAMFARRRTMRPEAGESQRKLQISGPYNFQHVSHAQKESLPNLESVSRRELASELSSMRPRRTTDASIISIQPDQLRITGLPSDVLRAQQDPSVGLNAGPSAQDQVNIAQSRQKTLPPTPPSPRRFTRRIPSLDNIRRSPPRPPRSPTSNAQASPVSPPPRTSSRASMRYDGFDPLSTTTLERPMTSAGFRQPQPFVPPSPEASRDSDTPEQDTVDDFVFSHAISTPDDVAWPLTMTGFPFPLADVPEEEELTRPSRMSITSNHSSLRGSVSVPLLRQMSLTQTAQRPPSSASETLGRFDLFAAQRALQAGICEEDEVEDLMRDNWEDDIDYCYDHAAEADCEYAWERPSCDMTREDRCDDNGAVRSRMDPRGSSCPVSSKMLSPVGIDVPALSPASQFSNGTQHEAVTPSALTVPAASNFSLPRRDSSAQLRRGDDQSLSRGSSFKESHGFNLSPSLLIPNDYQQQMLQYEREEYELDDEYLSSQFAKNVTLRSSASTTDSTLSEHSMTSSRHKSIASTSTAFTRWTGSSTSSFLQVHVEDLQTMVSKPHVDSDHIAVAANLETLPEAEAEAPALAPFSRQDSTREAGHNRAQSEANLLFKNSRNATTTTTADAKHSREPVKTRRRARTTSRSHNNAAPQFALFPPVSNRF
ncbi:Uu.00g081280.m01.CDS01 [Anthostomella pinea]|uniref:Uu.00g081280.m01.CDS01 n=1 Tax=Anthostomella pinea TaxID=933095 RepID=A0AAI8VLU7_9PEZI|nr:Uu.00g081280.m01.CDS01 [Anthostomella pinea]